MLIVIDNNFSIIPRLKKRKRDKGLYYTSQMVVHTIPLLCYSFFFFYSHRQHPYLIFLVSHSLPFLDFSLSLPLSFLWSLSLVCSLTHHCPQPFLCYIPSSHPLSHFAFPPRFCFFLCCDSTSCSARFCPSPLLVTPSSVTGYLSSPPRFTSLLPWVASFPVVALPPWQLGLLIWLFKFTTLGKYLGISVLVSEFLTWIWVWVTTLGYYVY